MILEYGQVRSHLYVQGVVLTHIHARFDGAMYSQPVGVHMKLDILYFYPQADRLSLHLLRARLVRNGRKLSVGQGKDQVAP